MKTSVLAFLTIIIVLIQHGECRYLSSFMDKLVETFVDKTTKIKEYVQGKGRSIKDFTVNVRDTVTSFLEKRDGLVQQERNLRAASDSTYGGEEVEVGNQKFLDFINDAEGNDEAIYESIKPCEKEDHKCLSDDPANHMTTPQLLALHGYVAESHTVVTEDGYILTLHRIPFAKKAEPKVAPRKTVLLHHGVLGSSADWVLTGPEKGLAFILADAGYDVWMANARGNTYSRAHVSLQVDSSAFWNFTWHEVSQNDLPATIDYIMQIKEAKDVKINYVGHSMGTTVLFALLSTKTEYNKVLRAGFALGPVAYMSDIRIPIKILARFADNINYILKLFGGYEFLPHNFVFRWLSRHAFEIKHYEELICKNSMFVLCVPEEKRFNSTLLPMILGHVPAGASTKTLIHYAQEIRDGGNFEQFGYGKAGNMKQYGTETPPKYDVQNITLPIALISAENDWLASSADVDKLAMQLPNLLCHYIVPCEEFNHIDFLYAVDAPKLVYKQLLQLIEEL